MSSRWGRIVMAKSVRKRTVKTVKTKPTMEQPEVAPDAIPIALPVKEEKKIPTIYVMVCQAGQYESLLAWTWMGNLQAPSVASLERWLFYGLILEHLRTTT